MQQSGAPESLRDPRGSRLRFIALPTVVLVERLTVLASEEKTGRLRLAFMALVGVLGFFATLVGIAAVLARVLFQVTMLLNTVLMILA